MTRTILLPALLSSIFSVAAVPLLAATGAAPLPPVGADGAVVLPGPAAGGALPASPAVPGIPRATAQGEIALSNPLALALERAALRDWPGAAAAVESQGQVAQDLVDWLRLRAGQGSLAEVQQFLARRGDWPGLAQLRRQAEGALAGVSGAEVLAWFGEGQAVTAQGMILQIGALRASGREAAAKALIRARWPDLRLQPLEQAALLAVAGGDLTPADHEARLRALLWADRRAEAEALFALLPPGLVKLAEARLALRADREGVDALIAAVPAELANDPLLAHARFDWRAKKGRRDGALEILRAQSRSPEALGTPAAWAGRRAVLARALLREGDAKGAYSLAANHHLSRSSALADLEFLSGFIALRALKDPSLALRHFEQLGASVSTPISVSRAEYWQGRALTALGRSAEATEAYRRAAQHQTAYYGLLASEELGLELAPALVTPPPPANWRQAGFLGASVTEAALLLYKAGDGAQARRFLLHLAESLDEAELMALGAFALSSKDPHLAVLVGKQAAARGIILPGIYFPKPDLMPEDLAVSAPLALAIARRESEFRVDAVSPAGALGLMQLMPGTAKLMADKLGLTNDTAALTRDPAYNARLGAAYLAHLAEEFGPSIALRAAGYNAGPGRPRAWVKDLGDPRQSAVDVIDWVEMVPFEETRTYIMRVSEGLAIYQARESGSGKIAVTAALRGAP